MAHLETAIHLLPSNPFDAVKAFDIVIKNLKGLDHVEIVPPRLSKTEEETT